MKYTTRFLPIHLPLHGNLLFHLLQICQYSTFVCFLRNLQCRLSRTVSSYSIKEQLCLSDYTVTSELFYNDLALKSGIDALLHLSITKALKLLWKRIQWWFVYPDTFVPVPYFRINEFSGLLNRPSVRTWKSVPTLFEQIITEMHNT